MHEGRELLDEARSSLESGNAMGAIGPLRTLASSGSLHDDPPSLAATIGLLAEVARAVGMEELATLCATAVPLEPQAVYDAGMATLGAGLPELAIPLLHFVDLWAPDEEGVLYPLASAYEDSFRHREAWQLVDGRACLTGFMADYLVAANAMCAGDVGVARGRIDAMVAPAEPPHAAAMLDSVRQLLARYDRAAPHTTLDEVDLRGWHYVLHGSQLLHLSPYGYPDPMRGRFAWLQDDCDRIALCQRRLVAALEAWGRPVQVLATPDDGSARVAAALAERLGVPVAPWSADAEGLVAVYDLADVDAEIQLALCSRSQRLYAHAMSWTDAPPNVPDFVGVLYQALVAPWGERVVMGEDGAESHTPEVVDDATWARRIAEASDAEDEDMPPADGLDVLVAFAKAVGPTVGERRYWGPGPVPSARFM
jgi:hypothetical protein